MNKVGVGFQSWFGTLFGIGTFRNQPDLEDAWPQFAGNKQALVVWIVSDSVQHCPRFQAIDRTQKTFEINPPHHPAALRGDPGNSIRLPHIGENLSLDEL